MSRRASQQDPVFLHAVRLAWPVPLLLLSLTVPLAPSGPNAHLAAAEGASAGTAAQEDAPAKQQGPKQDPKPQAEPDSKPEPKFGQESDPFSEDKDPFGKDPFGTGQGLFGSDKPEKQPSGPNVDPPADKPTDFPLEETLAVIAAAEKDPLAAANQIAKLGKQPPVAVMRALRDLDRRIESSRNPQTQALARQILLAIGRSGESDSIDYLYRVYESNTERRPTAAQALAQYVMTIRRRDVTDWQLLARALRIVEGQGARDVMNALREFRQRGTKPEWRRDVILVGLRQQEAGAADAVKLLEYWTGEQQGKPEESPQQQLARWQTWFDARYPDLPPAELPVEPANSKYKFAELLELVYGESAAAGDPQRGLAAFTKGQCVKCHKYGAVGETIGHDLSQIAGRMSRKELLEAIVFPSLDIPDQFATRVLITADGRTLAGLVGIDGDNYVVLGSDGSKQTVPRAAVEEIATSRLSSMPQGLLDALTPAEIVDLFAMLRRQTN